MKTILLIISFLILTFSIHPQMADEYIYVSIADGDSISSAFSRIERLSTVLPGAGMEGTTIQFMSAVDPDSTYYPLEYDGSTYEVTLTAGSDISLLPIAVYGLKKFIKLVTDVVQTGNNTFKCGYGSY